MPSIIVVIHVVVAIALILIVLLQTGKGADMGAAFGGGSSQTMFGAGGASTFMSKLTTLAAIVFMLTSLGLAYLSSHRATRSIMSDVPVPQTGQTEQVPSGIPVQPVAENAAEQADEQSSGAPARPEAKETDAEKTTPQLPGENEATQKPGGE